MARITEQSAHWRKTITVTCLALFASWTVTFIGILWAEPPAQRTFLSPGQASSTLFLAVQSDNEKTLLEIFGPDGKEIISSGDVAEDRISREQFVQKYRAMNRMVEESDGTIRLYVGAENWPMPVPLVNKGDAWYFDTAAGKQEIWFRQINGDNPSPSGISRCAKEYYAEARDGEPKQYPQKLHSDERKHKRPLLEDRQR